jgi:hypothetical protein
VRISRTLAVTVIGVLAFLSASRHPYPPRERRSLAVAGEHPAEAELDDSFVYDVVTRFNESLIANIDAIDTAVTAVLAGNVAIAVFAIDKIRELHHTEECWAIGLLSGSLLACVFAYVIGFPVGALRRDGTLPRRFIADVITRRDAATSSAIETAMQAGELNLTVRLWKRALVVAAIFLLLAGGVIVTLARLSGNMVQ